MAKSVVIPRIMIAAAQSGSGKTTITAGILALLRKRGVVPQGYKVGPDYIDPGYLSLASGRPVHNLDTWLTGKKTMARIFAETSRGAGVAVVEGVMGLYDGGRGGVSSSAEIAKLLKMPVVLVINAKSMGESAAALALGFREYDRDVDIKGVILNCLGSETHRELITEAMMRIGMPVLGAVFRRPDVSVPERHLGLLPVDENSGAAKAAAAAELVSQGIDIDAFLKTARGAEPLEYEEACPQPVQSRCRIAVAHDEAFSFYYPESLAELERAGAELVTFSPLRDRVLPDADGLIFGGGFPEMFAEKLSSNVSMRSAVKAAADSGMPIYAECGGYMYITRGITDFDGHTYQMAGVVPAACSMNKKLRTVGYVEAEATRGNVVCKAGDILRGHEFHFSTSEVCSDAEHFPWAFTFCKKRSGEKYSGGYARRNVLGSYLHLHFAGAPELAARFAAFCAEYRKRCDNR